MFLSHFVGQVVVKNKLMKNIKPLFILLLSLSLSMIYCTNDKSAITEKESPKEPIEEGGYDAVAAEKYGADAYGMKKYVLAFLKRGPNRDRTKEESAALQNAHMENIGRLAEEGILALAGPFLDDGELRGIYIFNVETIEEAEALTNTDPAIKAGSLVMELKEWYGSAAVMAINDIHQTLKKKSVTE